MDYKEKILESGNPAAIIALAQGDIENALIAATPGGIEAQEARGQQEFAANLTLPRSGNSWNSSCREQLEEMGIVFGEDVDDLFVEVKLPEGWKKVNRQLRHQRFRSERTLNPARYHRYIGHNCRHSNT